MLSSFLRINRTIEGIAPPFFSNTLVSSPSSRTTAELRAKRKSEWRSCHWGSGTNGSTARPPLHRMPRPLGFARGDTQLHFILVAVVASPQALTAVGYLCVFKLKEKRKANTKNTPYRLLAFVCAQR